MSSTASEVLSAVRRMAPLMRQRAGEIEQARRLPADIVEGLREAGLFRLWLPTEIGGAEADPVSVVRVIEELAAADGSVGWCAMLAIGTSAFSAYLPIRGAEEIFRSNIPTITGGVFASLGTATAEQDGYRVSGRWPFASGCDYSDWLCVGCRVVRDGTDDRGEDATAVLAFLPAGEIQIIDTWRALGLRGTGSKDIAVADAFVPATRVIGFDGRPWAAGPLWRFPLPGLLAGPVAAVCLGIARAALDDLVSVVRDGTRENQLGGWQWWVFERYRQRMVDREVVLSRIARSEGALRSARAFVLQSVQEAWEDVNRGIPITSERQSLLRLAAIQASRCAIEAVDAAFEIAGAAAIYDHSPMQRAFRDAHAAGQHILLSQNGLEVVGRVLVGGDSSP